MNEGFLSRWSRLKKRTDDLSGNAEADAKQAASGSTLLASGQVEVAKNTDAPLQGKFMPWAGINPAYQKVPEEALPGKDGSACGQVLDASNTRESTSAEGGLAPLPDIASLDMTSDFKPFMQPNVPAESRNAALKKLFADPSFNVMDGLDTYVADYSQPDPIPAEMLKELLKSKAFCLFDDPVESDEAAQAQEASDACLGDAAASLEPDLIAALPARNDSTEASVREASPLEKTSFPALETPGPRVALPPELKNEKQKGELGR